MSKLICDVDSLIHMHVNYYIINKNKNLKMAKIEKDFLERKNPTKSNFKAKPFMPRKPIPDLGHEKLDGKRFYTQDFMQKQMIGPHMEKIQEGVISLKLMKLHLRM